ncbi:MAG: glycosyltransferase [Bacillota bacterium]
MVQRPQQLMRQFARHGHPVFFCNLSQRRGAPPEAVEPNLTVIHDHERFLSHVAPDLRAPLVWCSWAKLHDRLAAYRPGAVLFDAVDDFPQWRRFEPAMLRIADGVTASAAALHERIRPHHPRVALLPNGCDFPFLSQPPAGGRPDDLPPPPVAGFVGAWAPWVDGRLLEQVAGALPAWNFAIIGPLFGRRELTAPNVHFLGYRPYSALPAYLHHLDVALLPFQRSQVTEAANPVKLWEYLAAGLPVVATPLRELAAHQELLFLAAQPGDFAAAIEAAGADRGRDRTAARRALAQQNDWSVRYRQVLSAFPDLFDPPGDGRGTP